MAPITLHTPRHTTDSTTTTEYNVAEISHIKSVTGDDDREGTHLWIAGSPERQFCVEPANKVRAMIEDAKTKEYVQLESDAVALLVHAVRTPDGEIHFIGGDGFLGVVAGDYRPEPFRGRERSRYESIRDQWLQNGFIVPLGDDLYRLTERGYSLGDLLAAHPAGTPFRGYVKLPKQPTAVKAVTFHQNTFNVNNAISQEGNVLQSVGDHNKVTFGEAKKSIWAALWKKIGPIRAVIAAKFRAIWASLGG